MERVIRFAYKELGRYFHLMTGADPKIILSVNDSLLENGMDLVLDDKYVINVHGGEGEIVGLNARSVLIGVYRFFRECGCVFFRPGKDGESIPIRSKEFLNISLTCRPQYRFRTITIEGSNSLGTILDLIDWSIKNGFNSYFTQFRDSNTFFERWYNRERNEHAPQRTLQPEEARAFVHLVSEELKKRGMLYHAVGHGWTCESIGYEPRGWYKVPPSRVSSRDREYLAEIGGVRKFYQDTPLYTQLCYSSELVQEKIINSVIEYVQDHPEVDYLHFWLGDNFNNFCECEKCARLTPSDWYVVLLNKLDERLTENHMPVKIVFLVYFELLWPPVKKQLKNPNRFIMMFAPITRTYSVSFLGEKQDLAKPVSLPEFHLNKLQFPANLKENLAFLYANQKRFSGDAFDFDYHLMWEPFKDLAGIRLAQVIHDDVIALQDLGLKGLVSCRIQKVFMPHGLGIYVMGHMLEDSTLAFEDLKKEYFEAAFGKHAAFIDETLHLFYDFKCPEYLRNESREVDMLQAERFADCVEQLRAKAKIIAKLRENETDKPVRLSLKLVAFYCQLCSYYLSALAAKARGENNKKVQEEFANLHRFLFENEREYGEYVDTFYFDLMSEQILNSKWNNVITA